MDDIRDAKYPVDERGERLSPVLARWLGSPQRKAILAKRLARAQRLSRAEQSVTTVQPAAATVVPRPTRSPERQAVIEQRRRLYQACFDANSAGLGGVTLAEADRLAEQIGREQATELIQTFGTSVFFEVMAVQYWQRSDDSGVSSEGH